MKKANGFSMIEISIVLIVIGIIFSSFSSMMAGSMNYTRIKNTNDRIAKIEDALALFFIKNNRLPCPADPTFATDNANFGSEQVDGNKSCMVNIDGTSYISFGMVPTKALNLPDSWAFDDWGRRIDYVVNRWYAKDHSAADLTFNGYYKIASTGNINVKFNSTPYLLTTQIRDDNDSTITNDAVYVIISHGKSGKGAWNASGTQLDASGLSAHEASNAYTSSYPNIFYQSTAIDDIVVFKTFDQLLFSTFTQDVVKCDGGGLYPDATPYQAAASVTPGSCQRCYPFGRWGAPYSSNPPGTSSCL